MKNKCCAIRKGYIFLLEMLLLQGNDHTFVTRCCGGIKCWYSSRPSGPLLSQGHVAGAGGKRRFGSKAFKMRKAGEKAECPDVTTRIHVCGVNATSSRVLLEEFYCSGCQCRAAVAASGVASPRSRADAGVTAPSANSYKLPGRVQGNSRLSMHA